MTNSITTNAAAERDRLYFQQERERLAALQEMDLEAIQFATELHDRLNHFDELDEAVAIETEGAPIRHGFTGHALPWLQMRRGEARTVVATAARRLQEAARELEQAAATTTRSGRLAHIARGYQALAVEALRVVESFGPGREQVQTDWARVDAIRDGIRRLEDRQDAELREEIRHDLASHERNREGLLSLGMTDYVAAEIDCNPALQRALREMREFVSTPAPAARL